MKKCELCKSQNPNVLAKGAFCFSRGNKVDVQQTIKLVGEIDQTTSLVEVTIFGETIDKVLQFEKPLLVDICKENQGLARILFSEVSLVGAFVLDPHGQIIAFHLTPTI